MGGTWEIENDGEREEREKKKIKRRERQGRIEKNKEGDRQQNKGKRE